MIPAPGSTFIIHSPFAPYLMLPRRAAPAAGSRPGRQRRLQDKVGLSPSSGCSTSPSLPGPSDPAAGTVCPHTLQGSALEGQGPSLSSRELGGSAEVQAATAGAPTAAALL